MEFVEEAMKNRLKSKNEGLEDGDKPPKLLMIHVLSKVQRMEQVGGAKVEARLKIGPKSAIGPVPTVHGSFLDGILKEAHSLRCLRLSFLYRAPNWVVGLIMSTETELPNHYNEGTSGSSQSNLDPILNIFLLYWKSVNCFPMKKTKNKSKNGAKTEKMKPPELRKETYRRW
ncbi:hypothetical protein M9H77_17410 [Catharanthus roseus]|uniref:Uncharacterized protein n=1 Tax=Catharanthus roseus TaxID=4058 RepID=A0ACC0B4J8_CATRO|nr:hypothetical protein M9H77_17410 [Catharanthus roseus]